MGGPGHISREGGRVMGRRAAEKCPQARPVQPGRQVQGDSRADSCPLSWRKSRPRITIWAATHTSQLHRTLLPRAETPREVVKWLRGLALGREQCWLTLAKNTAGPDPSEPSWTLHLKEQFPLTTGDQGHHSLCWPEGAMCKVRSEGGTGSCSLSLQRWQSLLHPPRSGPPRDDRP